MEKRTFIKIIFYSIASLFLPFKLSSIEKKIINPNLSEEQKRIMFGEGTERAGTSELNFEKRKGFLAKKHSSNLDPFEKIVNSLEEKSMWQKFGL